MANWSVRFFQGQDPADTEAPDIGFTIYRTDAAGTVWVVYLTADGPRQRVWVQGQKAPVFRLRDLRRWELIRPNAQLDFDPAVES